MKKKLYHFTSWLHVGGCKKQGLQLGVIPTLRNGGIAFVQGYQWLTENPDFNQSWCEHSSLSYDRSEYRLTVLIPSMRTRNLMRWSESHHLTSLAKDLSSFGDPENWWLYRGVVPPQWIQEVTHKQYKDKPGAAA